MKGVRRELGEVFALAFAELGLPREYGEVVIAEKSSPGQFQCNGALRAARISGDTPQVLAQKLITIVTTRDSHLTLSVTGPGFINVSVDNGRLAAAAAALAADSRLGCDVLGNRRVILDFGGPNVAKPMHVGHLRSAIIGDALQRLYRFMGDSVTSDVHLGDWGTQMGMVICGVRRERPELEYFDERFSGPYPTQSPVSVEDLGKIYPAESQLTKENTVARAAALQATVDLQAGRPGYMALWQHFVNISVTAIRKNYERLQISFDLWYGESHVNDRIPALLENLKEAGVAIRSEGALVVPLEPPPPMLLVKSDGAYLYATTDLATVEERVEDGAEAIEYVADSRQSLHFRQLFEVCRKSSVAPDDVFLRFHGYGTINGPDGRPFKTRTGGVMRLEELLDLVEAKARQRLAEVSAEKDYPAEEQENIVRAVALAALKFGDLVNNTSSDYSFDVERFTSFEGKTGPYLIYSVVRARSIARATAISSKSGLNLLPPVDAERPLVLACLGIPEVIANAYLMASPHLLAEAGFLLAQEFNSFYQRCNILHEADPEVQESRLRLVSLFERQLSLICDLLGIPVPERM